MGLAGDIGDIWEFPKIRGTLFGVPILIRTIMTIVFWGLYWGPPIFGNYHIVSHGDYIGIMEKKVETTIF